MIRTPEQVQKILSQSQSRARIQEAISHEQRVRLHTMVTVNTMQHQVVVPGSFFDFVDAILPNKQKFQKFMSLLRVPFPTVGLTDEIFSALEKVYDGRDPVQRRDFRNESLEADYLEYWEEDLGGGDRWKEQTAQAMRTAFNSLVVVDLPEEQETDRPAPYYYLLPLDRLVDFEMKGREFQMAAFYADDKKERLAVYDGEHYATYAITEKSGMVGELLTEAEHDLGYCPVQHFWHQGMNGDSFQRLSPVSIFLGELDHLLKDITFARHHKLYAGYPVWTGFKQQCGWQDQANETYCYKGFMRDMATNNGVVNPRSGGLVKCPKCAEGHEFAGPGTTILVDPPGPDNEQANLREPASIIEPGVPLLEFNRKDVEEAARKIYMAITGNSQEAVNDQAINEKQVTSLFEASTNVLMMLKTNLERSQNWVEMTIAKLRYGADAVAEFVTNYGSQFYIFQADTILEVYKMAREAKLDPVLLNTLQDQYYDTKYRHDAKMLERVHLISNLDPCRHLTSEEAKGLKAEGILSQVDYAVKVNFASLLMRFERENGAVTEFGDALPFDARVRSIMESLRGYAEEAMPKQGVVPGEQEQDGAEGTKPVQARQQPEPPKEGESKGKGEKSKGAKERMDAYGVGVRAGAITPQRADEDAFRAEMGLPAIGQEAGQKWEEDGGTRTPLTIKTTEDPTPAPGSGN